MTKKELQIVKKVLEQIKPRENGLGSHGKVLFAISLVDKEIAMREAQRDNFKDMYDLDDSFGSIW